MSRCLLRCLVSIALNHRLCRGARIRKPSGNKGVREPQLPTPNSSLPS
ncbi:hypothetical protein [Chamaesiphon polymorphus]|nr:hypothetical protein [Chamaesiphon polymorphus]